MHRYLHTMTMLCCTTLALAACSATPMRRNLKEAWRDGVIKADVKMRLAANNNVKARYVNVDVFRGVVSLSGRVEREAQRQVAEELARQSNEVVLVENHLVVRTPDDPRFISPNDGDMEAEAIAVRTVSVNVPLRVPKATTAKPYSDLAVGDPYAGKPLPEKALRVLQQQMPPVRATAARRIATPPPPGATAATTPDRTYSDLVVGDPLSRGAHPAPQVVPKAPVVTISTPRAIPAPVYLEKGVIPPAASVEKRVMTPPPVQAVSRPGPTLTGTQEATRAPVPAPAQAGTVDTGLAQEAAEELRRLKSTE